MDATASSESNAVKNKTTIERTSDRELVVTRTINGPARIVFEAWRNPDHFKKWWVPKSAPITLLSIQMDVRVGGGYRLEFGMTGHPPMAFHGKYLEVTPHSRILWTNDENGEGNGPVSTVTFEERGGKTVVVMHELYPSKQSLDEHLASGATAGNVETFDQLDEYVASMKS